MRLIPTLIHPGRLVYTVIHRYTHPGRLVYTVIHPYTHPGRHIYTVIHPYTHPGRHTTLYTHPMYTTQGGIPPYVHPEVHPWYTQGGIYRVGYPPNTPSGRHIQGVHTPYAFLSPVSLLVMVLCAERPPCPLGEPRLCHKC